MYSNYHLTALALCLLLCLLPTHVNTEKGEDDESAGKEEEEGKHLTGLNVCIEQGRNRQF
jgi:hypothetical protein